MLGVAQVLSEGGVSRCDSTTTGTSTLTDRMCTGVWTTMSKSLRLPDCGSTAESSPRSTRKMILSMCETEMLLRRFLLVVCSIFCDFGRRSSVRSVQGPGPM